MDAFEIIIEQQFDDIDILDLRKIEQDYINKYDSRNPEKGYNAMDVDMWIHKSEMSEDAKKRMNSDNEKRKLKVMSFDKDTGEFQKEFESVSDAARFYGTSSSNISRTCKGEINYMKGCVFIYSHDYNPEKCYKYIKKKRIFTEEHKANMRKTNSKNIKVEKYDNENHLVRTYCSLSEARREDNLSEGFLKRKNEDTKNGFKYIVIGRIIK